MPTINQLSATDTLTDGDQFFVYKQSSGDSRKIAASVISNYIEANLLATDSNSYVDQYESPIASGFSIIIPATDSNVNLYINPYATYATGSITLPNANSCISNQTVSIFTTQQINTITILPNGAIDILTVPTALAEDSGIVLKYNSNTLIWYRIA